MAEDSHSFRIPATWHRRRRRRGAALLFFSVVQLFEHGGVGAWNILQGQRPPRSISLRSRHGFRTSSKQRRSLPLFISVQSTSSSSSPSPASSAAGSSGNNPNQSHQPPGRRQTQNKKYHYNQKKKQQHQQPLKTGSIKIMFREAKTMERQGLWAEAANTYKRILERNPKDSYSHLALARLEARRETKPPSRYNTGSISTSTSDQPFQETRAYLAFATGTNCCPDSIHLWQAWAVYEDSRGNIDRAREIFDEALALDPQNPYVCHAFGLYEKRLGSTARAMELFSKALEHNSTAALVCSLGEILIRREKIEQARELYAKHLENLTKEKDRIEVYLASAWLEERYFKKFKLAKELLQSALELSPGSSLVNVALARLEGRMHQNKEHGAAGRKATAKRLSDACHEIEKGQQPPSDQNDGRVFNALAQIEVKARNYTKARDILRRGMRMYPLDHALFQAAGKVEERVGNYSAARRLYSESLQLEPSAPTLVAYAMLELRHPKRDTFDFTFVTGLFEEALLLDPRHGPAYNAYGNAEYQRGNIDEARAVFQRGVRAVCSDAASLYHGYGKLELSLGNVETARLILEKGLKEVRAKDVGSDSTHRERAKFLSHTLGMLELNTNRFARALEIFQDGSQRCGNSSRLLLGAALSEMKLGKEEAARSLFERAVMSDKKHAQAWQAWGVMETKAGNFKTASTLFQGGIRNAPNHGALWHGFASLELKKDQVHNARVIYAAGVQKAPQHVPLYQGWAVLELREGNYIDARKLIYEALTRNKKNGSGWLVAAQIEEEMGNVGLVSLILRRGIECAPNDAELYRKLGDYLVRKGKINDAREVFEQGMEVNPTYAPLYHSLAELEAMVCNLDGLAKLNKRAAELFNSNAMEPPKSSSQAFATKIRAKRSQSLPKGIAALAEKIVDEYEDDILDGVDSINPSMMLQSLNGNLMEDEFVGNLLSIDETLTLRSETNEL